MLTLLISLKAARPVLFPGPLSTPIKISGVIPFKDPSDPPLNKITAFSASASDVK